MGKISNIESFGKVINLILLGAPGAGKGTQAHILAKSRGLVQLSTGDLLREAVMKGTRAGKAAKQLMQAGELVSDEIVIDIVRDRLNDADIVAGVIFDGFPRTLIQAHALDEMLRDKEMKLDCVVLLEIQDSEIVERISGRYTCAGCGEGYHDLYKIPARIDVCDTCGDVKFKRRADDNAETVSERLKVYHSETSPLVKHYYNKGILKRIDSMRDIATVNAQLNDVLEEHLINAVGFAAITA